MPNMLTDGAEWLAGKLQDHAGTTVTYKRGHLSTGAIAATRTPRIHQVVDDDGLPTQVRRDGWLFTASDLVIAGGIVEPQVGDVVLIGSGASEQTYEVLPPSSITPAWEPEDAAGIIIVVHTKKVG